jgi:hypothetical protein
MTKTLLAALLFSSAVALADDPDPATMYEIKTGSAPEKLKAGEKGKVTIEIAPKAGAHVSDQAPLKIELTGKQVEPEKAKLTLADSVVKKQAGQEFVAPKFEVPFAAKTAGKGAVDAKMTFFICTEKICARQQKNVSIPVEVL